MNALDALIEAVEAGHFPDSVHAGEIGMGGDYNGLPVIVTMCRAFSGSLDAALALHGALLPGWEWMLGDRGSATVIPPLKLKAEHGTIGPTRRVDGNPARAWLLAILRAYRDKPPAT